MFELDWDYECKIVKKLLVIKEMWSWLPLGWMHFRLKSISSHIFYVSLHEIFCINVFRRMIRRKPQREY